MAKKTSAGRRNFLKTSAIGAAGFAIMGPTARKAHADTINTTLVNLSTTPINQNVDNLRVAYLQDAPAKTVTATSMVRSTNYPGWASFNNPTNTTTGVNYSLVKTYMDSLACALAAKTDPATAWATLLQKPASKTWATTTAVIKPNAFENMNPCVPIVSKICEVLIGFGMPAANITLCDNGGDCSKWLGTGMCPAGVKSSGGLANTVVFPASAGGESFGASSTVATADILVSIGCNKGHDQWVEYSGVTMSQKNTKGILWFSCNNNVANPAALGIQHLVNNNSCSYLLGNIPTTYPAKMQLYIVDSLWMGDNGDWTGNITSGNNGNAIVMGTFGGAVDYFTTMKIRSQIFQAGGNAGAGWNQSIVNNFIPGYGYPTSANTTVMTAVGATVAGPGYVNVPATSSSVIPQENPHLSREGIVQLSVSGNGIKTVNTTVYLTKGETVQSAEVFNVKGSKVRTLALNSGSNHILWDGRADSGSLAKAGSYVVRIKGQKSVASGEIVLSK